MPPVKTAQTTAVAPLAPAKPIDQFRQELIARRPMLASMLPSNIRPEKFESTVIAAIGANPKLLECSRASLMKASIEAAELGLSLNPALKEADILVRWDGRTKQNIAQFQPRFQGLMKLARQSGEIADIYAHAVRDGDEFDYELGLNKKLVHRPGPKRGALTHAYCVWVTRDGQKSFEVLTLDDVLKIKTRSSSKNREGELVGPWANDEEEMWRKSAVRRASKYMPMAADDFTKAVTIDNYREAGIEVGLQDGEIVAAEPIDITDSAPEPQHGKRAVDNLEAKVTQPARSAQAAAKQKQTVPYIAPQKIDDETTDWKAWSLSATSAIGTLPNIDAVAAFESQHADLLETADFEDPESAGTVREAIESRTRDLG